MGPTILAILFIVILLVVGPIFQTNDDGIMALTLLGDLPQKEGSITYISLFLSELIWTLNDVYQFHWYVVMVNTLPVGLFLVVFVCILKKKVALMDQPKALVTIVWMGYILLNYQFTISSGLLACASIFIFLFEMNSTALAVLLSSFLGYYSSLVRLEEWIYVTVILTVTLVIYEFVVGKSLAEKAFRSMTYCLPIVVVLLAHIIFHDLNNRLKGLGNEYSIERSVLQDKAVYMRMDPEDQIKVVNQTGWSTNDFTLVSRWWFNFDDFYNLENLEMANAILNEMYGEELGLREFVRHLLYSIKVNYEYWLLSISFLILILGSKPGREMIILAVVALAFLFLNYFLFTSIKYPPVRVTLPVFMFVIVVLAGLRPRVTVSARTIVVRWALGLVLVGLFLFFLNRAYSHRDLDFEPLVSHMKDQPGDYFLVGGGLFLNKVRPFQRLDLNGKSRLWITNNINFSEPNSFFDFEGRRTHLIFLKGQQVELSSRLQSFYMQHYQRDLILRSEHIVENYVFCSFGFK